MKIGQSPDIPEIATPVAKTNAGASSAAATATKAAATATPDPAAAKQAGVSVTVSSLTRSLETSGASGSFDAEKVAKMKAAIANGTFKVDAEAIADKLLSNAQQVLRGGQPG
ncbi:flagellar biosynthesis anti-sigma factor FlgM [Xylophilus sp. GOD-11R]|uniref:flagellar biosynthesis anti-sigma factor FlgM n=1 Tax=Xylophilus sp. GOD-11R TaxID=3089814 RepID=UPI00298C8E88|nr:flagellar biosynthesis anti-sigma factor FlgM [Xylophilus sp. GOD-11R]WPB57745.1 flagellar biosynthesis anti-sigma factor FlgM [Xylophilus sp. GOD-11R]